ncbi:Uncharacterised protein [uncultured archaeon]|nr:Uncharacterised protein [uncultured archaeon]
MAHPSNAQLEVCNGCCCGHPEKGNPKIDEGKVREAAKEAGLPATSLSFPYCLGPCSYANVARVKAGGRVWTFAGVNDEGLRREVMEFAKAPSDGNLGPRLRERLLDGY